MKEVSGAQPKQSDVTFFLDKSATGFRNALHREVVRPQASLDSTIQSNLVDRLGNLYTTRVTPMFTLKVSEKRILERIKTANYIRTALANLFSEPPETVTVQSDAVKALLDLLKADGTETTTLHPDETAALAELAVAWQQEHGGLILASAPDEEGPLPSPDGTTMPMALHAWHQRFTEADTQLQALASPVGDGDVEGDPDYVPRLSSAIGGSAMTVSPLSTHEAEALATYLAQKEGATPDETAWLERHILTVLEDSCPLNPVLQGYVHSCATQEGKPNSSHLRDALVAVAVKQPQLVFEGSTTFESVFDGYFSDCNEIANLPSSEVVKYTTQRNFFSVWAITWCVDESWRC